MPRPFVDITNQTFGRWTVLRFDQRKGHENYWLCRCECGTEKSVAHSPLKLGKSTSCGCFQKENLSEQRTTHGNSRKDQRSKEYSVWRNMLTRCENPNNFAYPDYGGRGIKIHEQWHDFPSFLADVGRCPSPELTLDRIDNNGNYEPGNVAWTTRKAQANNRRSSRHIEINGISKTLAEWCDCFGLNPKTVQSRVARGQSHKDAILSIRDKPNS